MDSEQAPAGLERWHSMWDLVGSSDVAMTVFIGVTVGAALYAAARGVTTNGSPAGVVGLAVMILGPLVGVTVLLTHSGWPVLHAAGAGMAATVALVWVHAFASLLGRVAR